ncbi:molybdopterin-guanine dinucleotide biosynthesis protein B [Paenibacillus oryzisoli]|uniref:molybdopterin-guanine dinucleotide biosynthesis protein B n=1 Tax=Paenibacillus oryzisoli TaxID=1850517 RepID=UPI003D2AFE4B
MANYVGFAGFSNSGKTTLIAKLVVELSRRGRSVVVMKHDAHGHYKEAEGKDSTGFMKAGASAVVTISPDAVRTYERKEEPSLAEQIEVHADADIILIEGFKRDKHPKIAVFRTIEQGRILDVLDSEPIAVVLDASLGEGDFKGPVMNINDVHGIADFIEMYVGLTNF